MLLSHDDASPFDVQGRQGRSAFFLICDHAGRLLPRALGTLGLSEVERARHIAWDIGALGVAQKLSVALDAPLVWQRYSRLVIDCNRPLDAADSIAARSERTAIPGNVGVGAEAAEVRAKEIFRPYHDEIHAALDRREEEGRATVLVAVHSFTPTFMDIARPWHIGVLYNRDARVAAPLLDLLRREGDLGDLRVGDNEPYAVTDQSDFSINHHGARRKIPHVELEIRQDLIADDVGQSAWAARLARLLPAAIRVLTFPPAAATSRPEH